MSTVASTQSPKSLASQVGPLTTPTPPSNFPGHGLSSSLPADQQDMARVYSASGIAIYWIINLVDQQVEVYSDPGSAGYQSTQIKKPGEEVPVVIDGALVGQIAVSELLPTREKRTSGGE
jgi:Putative restriction endonuclease